MSGGGGSTKQTTQSSSQPWKPAQAGIKYGLGEAQNLYKSGIGFKPYTGSTVVPYSQQTMGAMGTMGAKADMAQGAMIKPFNAYSQQIDTLAPIARGDFSQDKTFGQTLGRAQEDAANMVNMGASAAGRYGGAVHQGNVAREIGDLTNRAMLERQNWALNGLNQSAQGLASAYGTAMMPEQTQMQIGAMNEDLMARQMNDELRIFNEQQASPWNALQNYMAIMGGAGALGGQGSSVSSVQTPTNYGQAFGNALTGYSQAGIPGAVLGGMSGLF